MKLSDVHDGIKSCISRLSTPLAEVYGSHSQVIRIEGDSYCFDDSAEVDPDDLAEAQAEEDSDSGNATYFSFCFMFVGDMREFCDIRF